MSPTCSLVRRGMCPWQFARLFAVLLAVAFGALLIPRPVAAQNAPPHAPQRPGPVEHARGHASASPLVPPQHAPAVDVSTGVPPDATRLKALDAALPLQPAPQNSSRAVQPAADGFGYRATVVPFTWVEISGTGTLISSWTNKDDGTAGPFPIGFQFPFYDQQWQEFYANSNGFLSFGAGSDAYANQCPLPAASAPNNLIALVWDDLNLNISGNVYYQSFATCPLHGGQCLVVAYHDTALYGGVAASAGTWEAILYPSGQIILQYLDAGASAGSASTTGIEQANAPADYGLTYACNTAASLAGNLAVRFDAPPGVTLAPSLLATQGCHAEPQVHQFQATNRTGAAGAFALTYATTPGVTVQGPPRTVLAVNQSQPVTVTLTPHICPAPADAITATVTITGNGHGAVSTIAQAVAEGSTWQQLPSEPDGGRMDTVLAAYAGRIWSVTGAGADGKAEVRTFDPATSAWSTLTDSAPPFGENVARSGCQHEDKVYVYGDTTTPGFTGLWSYNLATNTWLHEAPGGTAPPDGIWAPAWARDADTSLCYLTGGATSSTPGTGDLTSVYVFDPISIVWQAPLPGFTTPRAFHAAFVWRQPSTNRRLLCVLGGANAVVARLASTQCYDFDAGAWGAENADLSALPAGWWGMGYAERFHDDARQFWLVGGSFDVGVTRSSFYYDGLMDAWYFGGALATSPVYRTSAIALDNVIYQVGGATSGFNHTGDANVLTDCPHCPGIRLDPAFIEATGCNNIAQTHRFSLWNDTAGAASFAMSYAATSGVTLHGPASVGTIPARARSVFDVSLTPSLCPEADVVVTATVTAAGAGQQVQAAIEKYVTSSTGWEAIASEPGDGREDHVLAAYAGKIWAIGGAGVGVIPVRTYNPATHGWSTVANSAPTWGNRRPRSGCQVGSRVYMYGDTGADQGLVYYDMATNEWRQVTGATNPPALAALQAPAWVFDPATNRCYLTGGANVPDGGNLATVYAYNPANNAWSTLPSFTTPRNWHAAFVIRRPTDNHALLCIAGGKHATQGNLDSTQCYDFTTGVWNPENADMGLLPERRWGMGYAQRIIGAVTQLWIVAGGNEYGETNDAIFFDFLRGEWRYDGFLATGFVVRGAAGTLGDAIYFTGGRTWNAALAQYEVTGKADRTVDCPACAGLFLQPERREAVSCAATAQTHAFELWNLTGATGNFALSYQPGAGIAASGPPSLTTNHGTVTPVTVTVAPLLCPTPGTQLAVNLGVTGNGYADASGLRTTISDAHWVWRPPMTSTHYGAAGVVLDDRLYVTGGYAPGFAPPYNRCQVYDGAAGAWSRCSPLAAGHLFGAAASDGQAVYVMGGVGDTGGAHAAVEALIGEAWQTRASLPEPRTSGAAAGNSGALYYSGGYDVDGNATSTFWRYIAADDSWASLPDLPEPVAEHAMVLAQDNLYLFPSANADVWIYSLTTASWRVVTPEHPAPWARGFLAIADGDHLLRIGGIDPVKLHGMADVWAFSLSKEDFTRALPMQQVRDLPVGGLIGGEPYVGLGADWDGRGPLDSLESLSQCPTCGAGLSIGKSGPAMARVGVPFTYTLTVTNHSNSAMTGLLVTDTLPGGVVHVTGGTLSGREVRFVAPELVAGATAQFRFVVRADEAGVVVNAYYGVRADQATAVGAVPVLTTVQTAQRELFLPLVAR